jgi:hypothetical protein
MYATQVNYLLRRGTQAASVASVAVARPNAEECEAKGQLVLLLEVPGSSARLQVAVDEFMRSIESAYYNGPANEPEAGLEQALRVANVGLPALCSHDKRWPERTSMAVLAYCGDQVYFATTGSIWGVLITPTRIATVTENGNRAATVNPLKPFSSIASGPLQPDSTVCFATLTLLDYIAQEKFRKLCADLPPLGVVQQLETLLSQASPQLNIAAIIVRRTPAGADIHPVSSSPLPPTAPTSQKSIHQLANQRQATAQLLSAPSLRQSLGHRLTSANAALRRAIAAITTPQLWADLTRSAKRSAAVARTAVATSRTRFTAVASYRWPPAAWITGLSLMVSGTIRWIRGLRSAQKLIVALVAAAIIALAGGIQWQQLRLAQRVPPVSASLLASISSNLDSATNALIYGDEGVAATALNDAKRQFDGVDPKQVVDSSLQPLRQRLVDLQRRLGRTVPISNLGVVASFPDQQPVGLALTNDILWTVTGAGLVKIDLSDGITTVASNVVSTGTLLAAEGSTAYAAGSTDVTEANDITVRTYPWQRLDEHNSTVAIAAYGSRLYALASDGNIYRYRRSGDTFAQGTAWLRSQPAGTGSGIVVDGAVYVLTPNNVLRYSQGNASPLSIAGVYPPLSDIQAFAVGNRALYLLEPSQKRLVAINKQTGRVEQQFTSDDLGAATALAVADDERTAYVVVGATVRSVDLTAR